MASAKNIATFAKPFFMGMLCLVLLLTSGGIMGVAGKERLIEQGPCSQFKDCNQYCLDNKFPLGGFCKELIPGQTSFCLCKST
ncbi:hypothetical protein SLEP1_g59227 [Rubroshorea leprosula]|uniref:Uncharacterized protein n=1 Tax=Rubroshorea leprosula TaxID=152421 RepID=A0AAV5MU66_9ROSI|nr:hypothetical protein SLEP1_g59227 [Rubroshorea leprosula]